LLSPRGAKNDMLKQMKPRLPEGASGPGLFARLPSTVGRITALYAHIPFCRSRCAYCGFVSTNRHAEADRDRYLDLLRHEAGYLAQRGLFAGRKASMLYLGGGTPSVLSPAQLSRLTQWLTGLLPLEREVEFTCEGHPNSLLGKHGQERLAALAEGGVNRVSLGVQDFVPAVLRACNRRYTFGEVREALHLARTAGIANTNLDFIYGLPGQTPDTWRKTLDQIIELHPENVTAYRVRLKPGTPMALRRAEEFPDDDACARMHESTITALTQAGYVHLLANQFAVAGYMFYNQFGLLGRTYRYEVDNYLPTRDTIGLGVSAHSVLEDRLLRNFPSRDDYDTAATRTGCVVETAVPLTTEQQQARMIVLGLRRPALGVSKGEFRARFGRDLTRQYVSIIEQLLSRGLVQDGGDAIRLTTQGQLRPNEIDEICATLYQALTEGARNRAGRTSRILGRRRMVVKARQGEEQNRKAEL
jgi:oxygen-independent coproporphyrinogen III oxidase